MKILVGLLALSMALNVFLWSRYSAQQNEVKSLQASAGEAEELRRQNQELQASRTSAQQSATTGDVQELARLRNEVGQLRRRTAEIESERARAMAETERLRAQAAEARLHAHVSANAAVAEQDLAEVAKCLPTNCVRSKRRRKQSLV